MTKWNLFQVYKTGSTFENDPKNLQIIHTGDDVE